MVIFLKSADATAVEMPKTAEEALAQLNQSDKENQTPNTARRMQSYQYKFYLEPEEDESAAVAETPRPSRVPLQEVRPSMARSLDDLDTLESNGSSPPPPPPPPPRRRTVTISARRSTSRRRITTLPSSSVRRRSDASSIAAASVTPSMGKRASKGRRSVGASASGIGGGGGGQARMGTRISLSALHRERLRLTTEMCLSGNPGHSLVTPGHNLATPLQPPPLPQRTDMDLNYEAMETKSVLQLLQEKQQVQIVIPPVECAAADSASLSESLIDRFDRMEAEDGEPERRIVSVTLAKDTEGRLGLKISGTASGVYVETVDASCRFMERDSRLTPGDRLVAVNGRSLENVPYAGVLELIRRSRETVQLLVSQIDSK